MGVGLVLCVATDARAHASFEQRLEHATADIEADPAHPEPWLRRAKLHLLAGDLDAAHRDLARAEHLAPEQPEVLHRRAELLLHQGAAAPALEVLERLLARHPDHVGAEVLRARTLRRLDRPLASAAAYDRAIVLRPGASPDVYLERARTLSEAGPEHAPRAISGLEEGLAQLGPLPALVEAALSLELEAGLLDAALARVEAEIERSPQPLWWMVRRAELLEAAGRSEEARAGYETARRRLGQVPPWRRSRRGFQELEARLRSSGAETRPGERR